MGSILAVKRTGLGKVRKDIRKHVTRRKKPIISIKHRKKKK